VGLDFKDETKAILILCFLLEIWNKLVVVMSKSTSNAKTLTFEDMVNTILSEDMRRKKICETQRMTLMVENRETSREKKKSPHRGKSKGISKSRSKDNLKCLYCKQKGYLKKEFWYFRKKKPLKKECW